MTYIPSRILVIGFAFATASLVSISARAGDEENPAALAKALSEASISLDQGLSASEGAGKPISGKFELDVCALQNANNGFRATSVEPTLDGDRPVASITFMKGEETKKVTESLD